MTTTKPCCEKCRAKHKQIPVAFAYCPCHAATATPEIKHHSLSPGATLPTYYMGGAGVQVVSDLNFDEPESVPAQGWVEEFDSKWPMLFSGNGQDQSHKLKEFIGQRIVAAREEGRHQGLVEAGKLVDEIHVHTKGSINRTMYMQGIEEGRLAMMEEIKGKIGFLRQWLNEDRITDSTSLVSNENIEKWLF